MLGAAVVNPATWFGRLLLRCMGGALRVQIFDRAMTLAAQAFTSIFPLLIMFGSLLGAQRTGGLADVMHLPDTSRRLLDQALDHQGISSFGVLSGLIVLFSATGLARAMVRAYAAVWEIGKVPGGPAAAGRWLLTVLLLSAAVVAGKLLGVLGDAMPLPHLSATALLFVADCLLATLLPVVLLGGALPVRRLLPGGIAYALTMLAVRPAGAVYLPRALRSSDDRYGTIGLAFTYISWLYVLSFCLLATAVIGWVLAGDQGLLGQLIRGETALSAVLVRLRQLPAVRHRRVQHHQGEPDGQDRPDRRGGGVAEVDQNGQAAQPDRGAAGPDPAHDQSAADHHERRAEHQVQPAEGGQPDPEQEVGAAAGERLGTDQGEAADHQMRAAQQEQH
ncbi:hypothetical protein Ari01nite_59610 [Paractinoplanes rishiriensis]|uniref:Uncharacterized protein n=1 Tax=Paractinoplanes rishiriensis TaxID=1050105 RepID=A0A919MSR9_9ACTN|nr:YhjD/YihY/BrkB family envelope integrity protein [Actinoplanes rishiriensis]GIE98496.1 hypothetical protein Ari01nite_59610 [Actinoplanes rishiriensis]